MKQPYITVRLTEKEITALKAIAKSKAATVNSIAAQLLRDYIKHYELNITVSERAGQ